MSQLHNVSYLSAIILLSMRWLCLSFLIAWSGGKPALARQIVLRADSRFALSQWETPLQSNAVSNWLGANQESALVQLRSNLLTPVVLNLDNHNERFLHEDSKLSQYSEISWYFIGISNDFIWLLKIIDSQRNFEENYYAFNGEHCLYLLMLLLSAHIWYIVYYW